MSQNPRGAYGPFLSTRSRGQACNISTQSSQATAEPEPTVILNNHQNQVPPLDITIENNMADISIPAFFGNPGDRADLWLVDFLAYCKCKGLNEERSQTSFRFFLKDHARQWYLSLPDAVREDYDVLVQRFKERFNGSDGGITLGSIKQSFGESCSAYFTRFLAATNQKNYPQDLLVQFCLDGLVDSIKQVLMLQNLTDFESVRLAALRAEKSLALQTSQVSSLTRVDKLANKLDRLTDILLQSRVESVNAAYPDYQPRQQQYPRQQPPRNQKTNSQPQLDANLCPKCLDGSLLGALMPMMFIFMLCAPVQEVNGEQILQRLNYGIVFQRESRLTLAREYWLHTFEIPLPETVPMPSIQFCRNPNIDCQSVAHVFSELNSVRLETFNRLNNTVSTINNLIPESELKRSRSKRSLLPFIGQFSKTLFGTATIDDVNTLAKHINALNTRTMGIAKALTQHGNHFSSFMSKNNERMDNLLLGIKENNRAIKFIQTQVQNTARNIEHSVEEITTLLIKQLTVSSHINHELDELKLAISNLVTGKLSPVLIPSHVLKSTFNQIQSILQANYNGFHIAAQDISEIYHASNFLYARNKTTLYVTIKIPITYTKDPLNLFKVISLPVPINETSTHATFIADLPKFVAITQNQQFYVTLKDTEVSKCKGISHKQCPFNFPLTPITKESCLLALFTNSKDKIHELCDFRFVHNIINSKVIELSSNKILLYQTPLLNIECGHEPKVIKGCNYCIFDLPCRCSITTSQFYLPPRLTKCLNHTQEITLSHPVNLVLLQEFFDNSKFQHVFANTMFQTNYNFTIPHFNFYQHEITNVLANDKKDHLSLSKMVEKAKKDETIFQSLAEPLLDGQITVPQIWPDTTDIMVIVALSLSAVSICSLILMFFKMKKLATTLMIVQQVQQAKAFSTNMPSLIYEHNTQKPLDSININVDLGWEHLILIISALNTILLLVIILKYTQRRKSSSIIVEIFSVQHCVTIPILRLPLCPSQYQFNPPTDITDLEIVGPWYARKLKFSWSNFTVSNLTSAQSLSVPNSVSISIFTAKRLRKLMKQQSFIHIFSEHNDLLTPIYVQ